MRRRLTILGCALAVLVVAWAVPVIALNAIQNKHEVDSMELVVENPDAYPLLEPLNWTDQKIASGADGVDARSWTSGRVEVIESVHRYSSSISALYAFSTQDPTFVSERSARPTTAEPPSGFEPIRRRSSARTSLRRTGRTTNAMHGVRGCDTDNIRSTLRLPMRFFPRRILPR
jgi:hypothetical protein